MMRIRLKRRMAGISLKANIGKKDGCWMGQNSSAAGFYTRFISFTSKDPGLKSFSPPFRALYSKLVSQRATHAKTCYI